MNVEYIHNFLSWGNWCHVIIRWMVIWSLSEPKHWSTSVIHAFGHNHGKILVGALRVYCASGRKFPCGMVNCRVKGHERSVHLKPNARKKLRNLHRSLEIKIARSDGTFKTCPWPFKDIQYSIVILYKLHDGESALRKNDVAIWTLLPKVSSQHEYWAYSGIDQTSDIPSPRLADALHGRLFP